MRHQSPSYRRSRIEGGDVLLSVKGTTGKVGIVPDSFRGNISRDIARLRVAPPNLPEYLKWTLETRMGQRVLERAVVGSTRSELSINILKRLEIPIPSPEEQRRILSVHKAAAGKLSALMLEREKLLALKTAIARDLLSGGTRAFDGEPV
ncbi:restriction endonuclease subunit S [Nocardia africana]|uniref:Restriction endonuclease subunit S n=1 Tax=Nocardia africana TaxID=134964 RepID=A0ABW6NQX3_9NOCA